MMTDAIVTGLMSELPALIRAQLPAPLAYCGVWEAAKAYTLNNLVTHDGSAWIARAAVQGLKPGTDAGAAAWTLMVKRGKDGRDGKDKA
jgi:chitodextrinase